MSRTDFTVMVSNLLSQMQLNGEHPLLDYALRSTEEQQRLFLAGKSKCDGVKKRSRHQDGLAVDIYLVHDGSIEWDKDKAKHYHDIWVGMGGGKVLNWDLGHFQID